MEELQHKIEALSAVCDADAGDASGALECSDQQDDMDTLLGKSLLQVIRRF